MSEKKKSERAKQRKTLPNVSFFPAWCKRCGNCVAFCPRNTLETDEWGYPYVARPENCISCHLCEKLCPDFAITVGDKAPSPAAEKTSEPRQVSRKSVLRRHSPERVARTPKAEEDDDA